MATVTTEGKRIAGPIMVQAFAAGTYPNIGGRVPLYRNKGDVFALAEERHFSKYWMLKIEPGSAPVLPPAPAPVPQTTGNFARRGDPFPPMQ